MSFTAILDQSPDESVKLDAVEKRTVLTTLEVIYDGGSLDGKTADFPTRDLERLVIGVHGGDRHSFETYERTISVDIRSRRTIFHCAGAQSFAIPGLSSKPNERSWWERLFAEPPIRKLKAIEI